MKVNRHTILQTKFKFNRCLLALVWTHRMHHVQHKCRRQTMHLHIRPGRSETTYMVYCPNRWELISRARKKNFFGDRTPLGRLPSGKTVIFCDFCMGDPLPIQYCCHFVSHLVVNTPRSSLLHECGIETVWEIKVTIIIKHYFIQNFSFPVPQLITWFIWFNPNQLC